MDWPSNRLGSADLRVLQAPMAALAARPLLVDLAIAGGLTLLSIVTVFGGATDIGAAGGGIGFLFLLLETAPLAVRRVWPVPVWVVTLGATVGHFLVSTGSPSTIRATLGALIALFTVSERYERRQSVWALAVTFVLVGGLIVVRTGFPAGLGGLVQISVAVVVPWVLGTWARERRAYTALAEARAAAAEERRDEEARRAVIEERERIARELHDVVAHNLSVIVIQAGAGVRAFPQQPDRSLGTLEAIEATAREALGEMRRMLSLLGPADGASELTPLPGLANLDALVDRVRAAGLDVDVTITGEPRPINPAVDLSAYRIIQEALTNTLRHSGAKAARVHVGYTTTGIDIEVTNDAPASEPAVASVEGAHPGRGLLGMRERVNLFGGDFQAGPRPDGGFRVAARIPVPT
jgi:signal transduction histidine kinase